MSAIPDESAVSAARYDSAPMHFPVNRLIADPRLEGVAAKAIWLVIPLEYYVLTRLDGGISVDSYVPAAAMALICVVAIIVASSIIALVYPRRESYANRVRSLTVSLLAIWGSSLALLALSYFVTSILSPSHVPHDIIEDFICRRWKCNVYPDITWQTFTGYAAYSMAAALLSAAAIRSISPPKNSLGLAGHERIAEPNIVIAAIAVAVVMMLLHSASTFS